jgi:predicted  nucleic acid-binding Zn-ribbon protein
VSAQGAAGAAAPSGETLLALQEADLRIDELVARRRTLPERTALHAVEAEAAALERRSRELAARREQRAAHERSLAASAGELGSRISLIQSQVASGRVSYRDQEALADELASLARRREELEDEELSDLTELDEIEQEAHGIAAQRPVLVARHRAARSALAAAEQALDAALGEACQSREAIARQLPAALLAEYDALRARLGGAVVARVTRGACAGCHLSLPATQADRLRHADPGTISRCEHCGRLLVV